MSMLVASALSVVNLNRKAANANRSAFGGKMTKIKISASDLMKNREEYKDVVGGGVFRVPPVQEVLQQIDIEKQIGKADKFREELDSRRDKRASKHQNIAEEEKFRREHPHLYEASRPRRVRLTGLFSLILICTLGFIVFRLDTLGDSQYFPAVGVILLLLVWLCG